MQESGLDLSDMQDWKPEDSKKTKLYPGGKKPLGPNPLSEDEAHDRANMLKAEAGRGPRTEYGGKGRNYAHSEEEFHFKDGNIEPITAEEYGKAEQAIEELEAVINDKVGMKKVLSKLGYGSLAILRIACDMPKILYGGVPDPTIQFEKIMSKETLNKAKAKLAKMMREGKEYGEENAYVNRYGIKSGKKR